jgi:hypothetical protein
MHEQISGHSMLAPVLLHDDLSERSRQELDDALVELCAHRNAVEYRLLAFVGEYDSRGLEGAPGVRGVAHWLDYRCGIDLGAAREKVRVARALRELPLVQAAFAAGTVSDSKVRAITRVATPANEGLVLGYAKAATASRLEQEAARKAHPGRDVSAETMAWDRSGVFEALEPPGNGKARGIVGRDGRI